MHGPTLPIFPLVQINQKHDSVNNSKHFYQHKALSSPAST